MNMSLDDLIKKSRTRPEGKPKGGSERQKDRPTPAARSTKGRGEFKAKPTVRTVAVANKKIQKTGGGAPARGRGGLVDRPDDRVSRLAALDGAAKWTHDKFVDEPEFRPRKNTGPTAAPGTKLKISNLEHSVSNDDIKELFSTCGPLKYHGIIFDRSGRSEGVAYVVYERPADAKKALEDYNNIALDGQLMNIEVVESRGEPGGMRLSSGISVSRGGLRSARDNPKFGRAFQQALGGNRGRNGQRAGNRNRLGSRVVRGASDLDKDLADYMDE